jgi:hypothetical protein
MHQEAASTANSGNLREISGKANEGDGAPTATPAPTPVSPMLPRRNPGDRTADGRDRPHHQHQPEDRGCFAVAVATALTAGENKIGREDGYGPQTEHRPPKKNLTQILRENPCAPTGA